jgi:hypothetical protein
VLLSSITRSVSTKAATEISSAPFTQTGASLPVSILGSWGSSLTMDLLKYTVCIRSIRNEFFSKFGFVDSVNL